MAYDDSWTDFHLTAQGWVRGASSHDSAGDAKPSDALLTMRRSVYQSSGYSAEDVTWSVEWKSESLTPERQKELLEAHGAEPGAPPMPAAPRRKRRENLDL